MQSHNALRSLGKLWNHCNFNNLCAAFSAWSRNLPVTPFCALSQLHNFLHEIKILCSDSIIFGAISIFCEQRFHFLHYLIILCTDCIIYSTISTFCGQLFLFVQWLHHFLHYLNIFAQLFHFVWWLHHSLHDIIILRSHSIVLHAISIFCVQLFHF